ncbi:hypothetical protein RND71_020498 [Anisodus tanguticus]|uniref:Uncharacterized protein n=1 Tax=Anisodus tanguticus TaxID=243964 RepID=A0AAE1S151_9SOLA|nr:hypothetical protein RND71_020498 [Anisodus tanguticus]
MSELIAFGDTKAHGKGIVEAGITDVPRIFVQPTKIEESISSCEYLPWMIDNILATFKQFMFLFTKNATVQKSHDKMSELKAFDDTKAGVKGLVDAGISETLKASTRTQSSIKRLWTKFEMHRRHGISSKWLIMAFQHPSWKRCCTEYDSFFSKMSRLRNSITLEILRKR